MSRITLIDNELAKAAQATTKCRLCNLIINLPDDDREDLTRILAERRPDGEYVRTARYIADLLARLDMPLSDSTIKRHRQAGH